MEDIVLFLHFTGLFLAGASAFGLPVVGAVAGKAPVEHRSSIGKAVKPLKMIGHTALALLIVTGGLLASMDGVFDAAPTWFWVKLVAVVCLVAGIVNAGRVGNRAMSGDAEAAAKMPMLSGINIGLGLAIVLSATLAFH